MNISHKYYSLAYRSEITNTEFYIMALVKKLVLDVLKPHQPNAIDFSSAIANAGMDYKVHLKVLEMDENTETIEIEIESESESIDLEVIQKIIAELGGSLHSIDAVEVISSVDSAD